MRTERYSDSHHAEQKRQRRLAEAERLGIRVERRGKAYHLQGHGVDCLVADLAMLSDDWAQPATVRPRTRT